MGTVLIGFSVVYPLFWNARAYGRHIQRRVTCAASAGLIISALGFAAGVRLQFAEARLLRPKSVMASALVPRLRPCHEIRLGAIK